MDTAPGCQPCFIVVGQEPVRPPCASSVPLYRTGSYDRGLVTSLSCRLPPSVLVVRLLALPFVLLLASVPLAPAAHAQADSTDTRPSVRVYAEFGGGTHHDRDGVTHATIYPALRLQLGRHALVLRHLSGNQPRGISFSRRTPPRNSFVETALLYEWSFGLRDLRFGAATGVSRYAERLYRRYDVTTEEGYIETVRERVVEERLGLPVEVRMALLLGADVALALRFGVTFSERAPVFGTSGTFQF